jgi:hypothetical protein
LGTVVTHCTYVAVFSSNVGALAVMQLRSSGAIALLIMSMLYFVGVGLLFSPSVKSYFQARGRRYR